MPSWFQTFKCPKCWKDRKCSEMWRRAAICLVQSSKEVPKKKFHVLTVINTLLQLFSFMLSLLVKLARTGNRKWTTSSHVWPQIQYYNTPSPSPDSPLLFLPQKHTNIQSQLFVYCVWMCTEAELQSEVRQWAELRPHWRLSLTDNTVWGRDRLWPCGGGTARTLLCSSPFTLFFFLLPDSLTDRRRLGSCFLRLISSSFLSSTVSRSSFERKKRETEKNLFMWKKRKIKLLEGCLCRGHHGNPYQPNPFNVNASSSVALLSKACGGQKKSCSVCALSG